MCFLVAEFLIFKCIGKVVFQDGTIAAPAPRNIRMDESGRLIDEKGNVIEVTHSKSFKINKKDERKKNMRPLRSIQRKAQIDTLKLKQSDHFDPELETKSENKRQRRKVMGLHFSEQGSYIKRAEFQRKKETLGTGETGEDGETIEMPHVEEDPKQKIIRKIGQLKALDPIPEVEWWDAEFLPENKKTFGIERQENQSIEDRASLSVPIHLEDFIVDDEGFNTKKITHYVQHPVPVKNPNVEAIRGKTKILLTDKERKRLKKLRKAEKVKERHEKISLGLIPAPAPRLKMSSFMRAVTAQAVADPSKVEKEVRRQEIERQKAHIEHNENRRLTKAQRIEKLKTKSERDAKKETWSALFKIRSLKNPRNFFKVDKNAQQLYLNGF